MVGALRRVELPGSRARLPTGRQDKCLLRVARISSAAAVALENRPLAEPDPQGARFASCHSLCFISVPPTFNHVTSLTLARDGRALEEGLAATRHAPA